MRNIKLLIEYDGTNYHGWQRQPNGITIQEIMENTLFKITSEKTTIIASGRTDSGVHALGQVANFKTVSLMEDISFLKAFNSILPRDIVIKDAVTVDDKFNARYSAKSKVYRYCILNRSYPSSFDYRYSWLIRQPLDADAIKEAAAFLIGTHDFSSFRSSSCEAKDPIRTLHRSDIEKSGDKIFLWCEADGFLKQMVRNIVGTLVYAGKDKFKPHTMKKILENRNRSSAGPTAPPQGLFLVEVKY
ncbi:MAG: tRNA pseudouridine(38-40) synthase TruA [Nitrospinae bacterium]|nr:tRNA pseudouridine(38-40) synthase TruA [Nitrospinota bacterium]